MIFRESRQLSLDIDDITLFANKCHTQNFFKDSSIFLAKKYLIKIFSPFEHFWLFLQSKTYIIHYITFIVFLRFHYNFFYKYHQQILIVNLNGTLNNRTHYTLMSRVLHEVYNREQGIEYRRDSSSGGDYGIVFSFCSRLFLTLYVSILFSNLLSKISCLWIGWPLDAQTEKEFYSPCLKRNVEWTRNHCSRNL